MFVVDVETADVFVRHLSWLLEDVLHGTWHSARHAGWQILGKHRHGLLRLMQECYVAWQGSSVGRMLLALLTPYSQCMHPPQRPKERTGGEPVVKAHAVAHNARLARS